MLIIRHFDSAVFIPEDSEFSVYTEGFPINKQGKRLSSSDDSEFADSDLDLVIETLHRRYRFKWISPGLNLELFFCKLQEALSSGEKVKVIELEEIFENDPFYDGAIGFSVETITK